MRKNIKLINFILILVILFIIYVVVTFRSQDYNLEYQVNHLNIKEVYTKNDKYYTFYVSKDSFTYPFKIQSKYLRKRKLINDIEVIAKQEEECLLPKSDYLTFDYLCRNNQEFYEGYLSENLNITFKKIAKLDKTFQNIKINYLNNKVYLLYNYKGFYYLNGKQFLNIKLFNKDVYNINLIYQLANYLVVPNYNEEHYFSSFYVLNMQDGKYKEIESDYEIYFDSIFLGDYKNKIYLLDKKMKKEYTIDIKKEKIQEVDLQVLENKKMVTKTFNEIVSNNLVFYPKNVNNYELINNILYKKIDNIKIKLSNKEVSKIIKNDEDTVYYLVNEDLYMYNNDWGEVLLLSNFEWNFNDNNMIFLN